MKSNWDHSPITKDMLACANCLYFVDKRYDSGECHRYAPRPTQSLDVMKAEALAHIAWYQTPADVDDKIETEAYEAYDAVRWSSVDNYEFCGDFRSKWEKPVMRRCKQPIETFYSKKDRT